MTSPTSPTSPTTPTTTIPSGDELPVVGAGTWRLQGDTVRQSVTAALDAGYTHIDTAEGYQNEAEIGDAIAASEVDRDDLFLTSKVLAKNLNYESVISACEDSLEKLGTDYLDLYLIHWPNPTISLRETLDAMATLHEDGTVKNIGVSNFSAYQLSAAHHIADVPIAVNQIEFHPWFQRPDLTEYCRETDTTIEAAAPLARLEFIEDDTIQDIADTYDRTPVQVILRWAIEEGVVPLPRSSSPEHVRENFDLFDWELDDADHDRISALDQNHPVYDHPARDWTSDVWGISQ